MRDKSTFITVKLGAIRRNVEKIVSTYSDYQYRIAVVKSDSYGHKGNEVVRRMIEGGANYIAVSFIGEALRIREKFKDIPVMLLVPPPVELIETCVEHDIEVTVRDIDYLQAIADKNVKVHLRMDGGCDLYNGPRDKESFRQFIDVIDRGACTLQGLYIHNYFVEDEVLSNAEFAAFEAMTEGFDLASVPVVSTHNSMALVEYEKKPYSNAFRMGNVMYGIENTSLELEDTFQLYCDVLSIKHLAAGQSVGYSKCYEAKGEEAYIAMLPIGYGDGFAKSNIGRDIFIAEKRFKIVGVTMDITLVKVDETVGVGDRCTLIQSARHLDEIAEHIHTIAEEELCLLNTRIERMYLED
ncbi:MAG: alanine racemase [Clostridia bacterium]|nr:alanine racemase [Clostridia bacterium]